MSASAPPAEGAARRTVAQKMGIKPGIRAHLVAAPSPAVLALQLPTLVISVESSRVVYDRPGDGRGVEV